MVLLYALGWVLIAMRTRLDTYVNLLQAALKDDDGVVAAVGTPASNSRIG